MRNKTQNHFSKCQSSLEVWGRLGRRGGEGEWDIHLVNKVRSQIVFRNSIILFKIFSLFGGFQLYNFKGRNREKCNVYWYFLLLWGYRTVSNGSDAKSKKIFFIRALPALKLFLRRFLSLKNVIFFLEGTFFHIFINLTENQHVLNRIKH